MAGLILILFDLIDRSIEEVYTLISPPQEEKLADKPRPQDGEPEELSTEDALKRTHPISVSAVRPGSVLKIPALPENMKRWR
jgi:hypothetical protein